MYTVKFKGSVLLRAQRSRSKHKLVARNREQIFVESRELQIFYRYKQKMYLTLVMIALCMSYSYTKGNSAVSNTVNLSTNSSEPIGCVCAVFLSAQFKKGSKEQPKGYPALLHEYPDRLPCNAIGDKLCTNKCLEVIVKHLPNSATILCASIDRDCHKERAYLFMKNCKDEWTNTNLSAGKEYCCKDGLPYKCR